MDVIFLLIIVVLLASSAWLQSSNFYLLTIVVSVIASISFFYGAISQSIIVDDLVSLVEHFGALLFVSGLFYLFITTKYLTNSGFFDLEHFGVDKAIAYIDKKGFRTKYESFYVGFSKVYTVYALVFLVLVGVKKALL